MAITKINNQAVKLYEQSETTFNEKTEACNWHADYYNLVTCDDITEVIFDSSESTGNDISLDPDIGTEITGGTTSTASNKLIDAGANFGGGTVNTNMIARNLDTNQTANITAIDSNIQLSLDDDIFTDILSEDYSISYYELTGNTSISSGTLVKTSGGVGSISQSPLSIDKSYKVEISLLSVSSVGVDDSLTVKIGGNTVAVYDASELEATTLTFYGSSSSNSISLEMGASLEASFTDFKIYELSNLTYIVRSCVDDSVVYTSSPSDNLKSVTSTQINSKFDWSNLMSGYDCDCGCYYIEYIETEADVQNLEDNRVDNGDFSGGSSGWSLGTGWSIVSNIAVLFSATAGKLIQSTLSYSFYAGFSYDFSFRILAFVIGSVRVRLYLGTTLVKDLGTYTAAGLYTISTGILTSNCDRVEFEPQGGGLQSYSIDEVSATVNLEDTGYLYKTDCFQLCLDTDCTIKLSGTNLDNAFGIDFIGTNYNPFVRVQGELRTPKYDEDVETEEDSNGTNTMLYFNSDKKYTLHLYDLPEYLHDFIRLLKGYDRFLLDDVEYIAKSEGYDPEWVIEKNKVFDLAKVNFTVINKTELNKNKYC